MPEPEPPASADDLRRFRANFRDEVDGAALYRMLAAAEDDDNLRQVFERLAATEDRHRRLWERKIVAAGQALPSTKPSFRVRVLGMLARRFGTGAVMPIVQRMETDAVTMYDTQADASEAGLPQDERSHARIFGEIARSKTSISGGSDIALIEGRHRTASGNALRAAVLGVNDGLVSNLSLVMAFAGADPGQSVVVLAGVGGLLAGSLSMALGEWISVRSSAEAYERQVAIERDELLHFPEEEREELALIYESKGFTAAEAQEIARRAIENRPAALDTLVREELGMSPEDVGNPWVAAAVSFVMFAIGAIVPVAPWFFAGGPVGLTISVVLAGLALLLVGAATTLFTGRSPWFAGGRMLLFGLAAAAITYGIGSVIGVSAGI